MPKKRIQVLTACSWCQKSWWRRKGQKGNPACSDECRANMRRYETGNTSCKWPQAAQCRSRRVYFLNCNVCATLFTSPKPGKMCCSKSCAQLHRAKKTSCEWPRQLRGKSMRVFFIECVTCAKLFSTSRPEKKCCSESCAQRRHAHINRRPVYFINCRDCGCFCSAKHYSSKSCAPCQSVRDYMATKQLSFKRKSRKVASLLPYIGARDKWTCHICGDKVKSKIYKNTDKLSPTIDHLIPVAQGGSDDLANLRLAHMICNSSKGKYGGNEQLLLVG
jgi:hypothetical protein